MSDPMPPVEQALVVLVTGSREGVDPMSVWGVLSKIHEGSRGPISDVVSGGCRGVDSDSEDWAKAHEVRYHGWPARWSTEGKSAGPRRNARMVAFFEPDIVVAFAPDIVASKGTRNCIARAITYCPAAYLVSGGPETIRGLTVEEVDGWGREGVA